MIKYFIISVINFLLILFYGSIWNLLDIREIIGIISKKYYFFFKFIESLVVYYYFIIWYFFFIKILKYFK